MSSAKDTEGGVTSMSFMYAHYIAILMVNLVSEPWHFGASQHFQTKLYHIVRHKSHIPYIPVISPWNRLRKNFWFDTPPFPHIVGESGTEEQFPVTQLWPCCWGHLSQSGTSSLGGVENPSLIFPLLVLNAENGWVAGGCWDYHSYLLWIIPSFPTFSTSKIKWRDLLWEMGDYGRLWEFPACHVWHRRLGKIYPALHRCFHGHHPP